RFGHESQQHLGGRYLDLQTLLRVPLNLVVESHTGCSRYGDHHSARAIDAGRLHYFPNRLLRRPAFGGMLALNDPELSILNAKDVAALIASPSDEPDLLEAIGNHKSGDVTFEGLPRAAH